MGSVISPLGLKPELFFTQPNKFRPVEFSPLGISFRTKISKTLETGVVLVDLLVPLGLGQRELILGDRKTGKTNFLLQTLHNQAKKGIICIYVAIGKRKTEIKKAVDFFASKGIANQIITVATSSHDSAGEIFLAPYSGMAIAEYFRDLGKDVLIIMDDMSTHARFYREISLLNKRFPGRDSYPGDIFHIHSRLLERAGNFLVNDNPVSITCLPAAESPQGDITGYIQTNLMSMTDGHIYFDAELFFKGRRPAINPFLSVTRVGHQTQSKLQKDIRQKILDLFSRYEKTVGFQRFGAELGENSRQIIALGEKIYRFLDQPLGLAVPANLQMFLLAKLWQGSIQTADFETNVKHYVSDQEFARQVDAAISSCNSFSKLQSTVRAL
jgi:F-type H+-transporting ATPase subunit alpha